MKNKPQLALTLAFLAFVVWWASFQHVVTKQGLSVQWFGGTYGVLALFGAVAGFTAAHKWGGFKTVLGKALTLFSFGLLAQEAGQLIYTYYIYGAKIQIPYPSWGDAAYFGSVLIYVAAALVLSHLSGVKFSLKENKGRAVAVLVPLVLLSASYWIFLYHHQYDTSKPLTVFLDFGYPMVQAIYISIAITAYLLSLKMLGGVMKNGIRLIVLALTVQYVADFNFVYQSSRGTYLSGKYADLIYLVSYFAMATALLKFRTIHNGLRKKVQATPPAPAAPAPTPEAPTPDANTTEGA